MNSRHGCSNSGAADAPRQAIFPAWQHLQLDELFALLSAVKTGEVSDVEAIQRLSRSPHWVWGAIDPVTRLLLALDVGDRTLEMAQRLVHIPNLPDAPLRTPICPYLNIFSCHNM